MLDRHVLAAGGCSSGAPVLVATVQGLQMAQSMKKAQQWGPPSPPPSPPPPAAVEAQAAIEGAQAPEAAAVEVAAVTTETAEAAEDLVETAAGAAAGAAAEEAAEAEAAAAAAAVEAAEWAAAEAEMESVEAPVPLVDERTLKLFEAALWELAEGDGEEAGARDSGEGSGDVSEPLDHSIGGSLDASARHVHAADSLSRDVAGKMSLEEEAILNNLDNLPGAPDRSQLVRNLENIIHRTDG